MGGGGVWIKSITYILILYTLCNVLSFYFNIYHNTVNQQIMKNGKILQGHSSNFGKWYKKKIFWFWHISCLKMCIIISQNHSCCRILWPNLSSKNLHYNWTICNMFGRHNLWQQHQQFSLNRPVWFGVFHCSTTEKVSKISDHPEKSSTNISFSQLQYESQC